MSLNDTFTFFAGFRGRAPFFGPGALLEPSGRPGIKPSGLFGLAGLSSCLRRLQFWRDLRNIREEAVTDVTSDSSIIPAAPVNPGLPSTHFFTREQRSQAEAFMAGSMAPSTRASYSSAWRRFAAWCMAEGHTPLPAAAPVVVVYLSELAASGFALSSVASARAAIGAVHRHRREADPAADAEVRRVMSGISRALGRVQRQARPLDAVALGVLRTNACRPRRFAGSGCLEAEERAWRRGLFDLALASVLRYGLLRISEAAALLWSDLDFRDEGSVTVTVRSSKTDQSGEGAALYLGRLGRQALLDLKALRPEDAPEEEPVFGLSVRQLQRRLHAAAVASGLGEGFTGHSGRVGMTQDLVAAGAELPALMVAGRWSSPAMAARYSRRLLAARGAVAAYCTSRNE